MPEAAMHDTKQSEERAHDETYGQLAGEQLGTFTVEEFERQVTTPAYEDNGEMNGDLTAIFLSLVFSKLEALGKEAKILDYGCGMGKLSILLATRGYSRVYGFDLSAEGVKFGSSTAQRLGLGDRVHLSKMDAEALEYPDAFFDIVIGKSVLHHTIKYPKATYELRRVMKPKAIAIFKENIGNNPLIKLARYVTMDVFGDHGDVNITTTIFNEFAANFSHSEVTAYNFLYAGKRLLWKPGYQAQWRKSAMRLLKKIDDVTVARWPAAARLLCGDAIYVVQK